MGELMFYLGLAVAKQGAEQRRVGGEGPGNARMKQALRWLDEAEQDQMENAWLHYSYATVLSLVRVEDRENDQSQRYSERLRSQIESARKHVKPTDPKYVEIMLLHYQQLVAQAKRPEAQAVLDEACKAKPQDQHLALAKAKFLRLDPAMRPRRLRC
ncbi:MAG: hypothetical protein QM813_05975 [Verrucomicrobiota bacterium]